MPYRINDLNTRTVNAADFVEVDFDDSGRASGKVTAGSIAALAIGLIGSGNGYITYSAGTFTLNVGTSSGTVCAGNDSRLANARTPTAHTHPASDINTGVLDTARLANSGTASVTTILFGDQTWKTLNTNVVPESGSTNIYFTNTRAIGATLTGVDVSLTGSVSATDTVLQAFGRLENRMALNDAKIGYTDEAVDLRINAALAGTANAANQNVAFSSEAAVIASYYVGPRYRWANLGSLLSASVVCSAPSVSDQSFTLEINGDLTAFVLTVPAGESAAEIDLTSGGDLIVPVGQYIRWKCTSAPADIVNCASQVFISTNLNVAYA